MSARMTPSPLRVVVTGINGRMGSTLARMIREAKDLTLVAATEKAPVSGLDVPVVTRLEDAIAQAQVVIDFSTPEASLQHARVCAAAGLPLVIGTTGFSPEGLEALHLAARTAPIFSAPNMSVGVNLVIEVAALLAKRLGEDFDVEVLEAHHRHKQDAPSGTALRLADELRKALGRNPEDLRTSRVGQVGPRPRREIGVQTLRGGDVVGEHTVYFLGDGERVELTHRATSREQFARGALRAARWLVHREPGLYGMAQVLAG
jgi:4-hydroxy-tetrahydrodipicolinate reductase